MAVAEQQMHIVLYKPIVIRLSGDEEPNGNHLMILDIYICIQQHVAIRLLSSFPDGRTDIKYTRSLPQMQRAPVSL